MYELIKKDAKFEMTAKHRVCFQSLKRQADRHSEPRSVRCEKTTAANNRHQCSGYFGCSVSRWSSCCLRIQKVDKSRDELLPNGARAASVLLVHNATLLPVLGWPALHVDNRPQTVGNFAWSEIINIKNRSSKSAKMGNGSSKLQLRHSSQAVSANSGC